MWHYITQFLEKRRHKRQKSLHKITKKTSRNAGICETFLVMHLHKFTCGKRSPNYYFIVEGWCCCFFLWHFSIEGSFLNPNPIPPPTPCQCLWNHSLKLGLISYLIGGFHKKMISLYFLTLYAVDATFLKLGFTP